MRRIARAVALATVFATTSCSGGGSPGAAAPLAPNNPAPGATSPAPGGTASPPPPTGTTASPMPTPTPSTAPQAAHTVSISGDPTFTSLGVTQYYTPSETNAATGAYFFASLNAACNGAANLIGQNGPSTAPSGEVAGTEFLVTALLDSTSCVLTVTASDSGASASLQLNIAAPMATVSPFPVQ